MSDPLNPWEEKDRLEPSGDLSPLPEDNSGDEGSDIGVVDGRGDINADSTRSDGATRDATDGADANDLEVDNAVEADSVETLDPENPPV
jgi:hypothetical protein